MLDPEALKRRVISGYGDRNLMAEIVKELAKEINKVNKTKPSMKKFAELEKAVNEIKNAP